MAKLKKKEKEQKPFPVICKPKVIANDVLVPVIGRTAKQLKKFRQFINQKTFESRIKFSLETLNRTLYYTPTNDVNDVPDFIGVYTKGQPHNELGIPDPNTVRAKYSVVSGQDINQMPNIRYPTQAQLFNPPPIFSFPQISTQNEMYLRMTFMPNPASYGSVPNPTFGSDETAAEMIELYGASLIRDIPFTDWATNPVIAMVVNYLNAAGPAYKGPRDPNTGLVTPQTLFKFEFIPGGALALPGPYVSQLFYIPMQTNGEYLQDLSNYEPQKLFTTVNNPTSNRYWGSTGNPADPLDYFINSEAVQGQNQNRVNLALYPPPPVGPVAKFLQTPRDAASWHQVPGPDTFIRILNTILNQPDPNTLNTSANVNYLNPLNPQRTGVIPFQDNDAGTFGTPQDYWAWLGESFQQTFMVEGVTKGVYQRARPEAIGIEVQRNKTLGVTKYYNNPLLLNSGVLNAVFALAKAVLGTGNYFLSQYYWYGAPTSSSYPSGYVITTACGVTILKAILAPDIKLPAFVPDASGTNLIPTGETLLMVDELDKFAYNGAFDRMVKGFHYRSDVMEALRIGEQIAIDYLTIKAQEYAGAFPTNTKPGQPVGWRIRKFDRTTIDIIVPQC